MTTRNDALAIGRPGWTEVASDFAGLLGRALALAVAVGLLLTAAAVALPSPAAEGGEEGRPATHALPAAERGTRR